MYDWHAIFGILSTALLALGIVPYSFSIIKGNTRPNPLSLIGWSVMSAIPAAAQLAAGADWSIVIPLSSVFNNIIYFAIAYRMKRLSRFHPADKYVFLFGLVAIVVWLVSDDPLLAIYISICANALFTVPTIIKTHRHPLQESLFCWVLYDIACIFGILSISSFQMQNIAFPIYAIASGIIVTVLASRKPSRRGKIYA